MSRGALESHEVHIWMFPAALAARCLEGSSLQENETREAGIEHRKKRDAEGFGWLTMQGHALLPLLRSASVKSRRRTVSGFAEALRV